MNRETIIAISLGIALGAVVAFVVLFQTNKADEVKVVPVTPRKDSAPDSKEEDIPLTPELLTISSPEQGIVTKTDVITITGKAPKKSLIIVQSPVFEKVFKIEGEQLSVDVDLARGENVIQLSAYTESSTPQQQTLRVYFIEE